jgi:ribonuclease P protein component
VLEEAMREEDVPAEQPEAEEEARLPAPHADPRGSRDDPAAAREGSRPPVGLIWRVRDRASFRALAAGARRRRGVLTVTCVRATDDRPPRVAYAVGRHAGGAVTRNRIRRRLRAVVRDEAALLRPGHLYLVGASAAAAHTAYRDLRATLRAILREVHAEATA